MTLIELLTALAVAGIVMSLGITVYSGQAERSRVRDAVVGIERIALEISLYSTRPDRLAAGLPDQLAEVGIAPALLSDPWGRPYRYARLEGAAASAASSRHRSGRPLNRDYDLFSLGPNGATSPDIDDDPAFDDVLRAADGAFVGTPGDYGIVAGDLAAQLSAGGRPDARKGRMDPRKGRP